MCAHVVKTTGNLRCTTPTLEEWRIGFCINGPFAVDVGRGQLARKADENRQIRLL